MAFTLSPGIGKTMALVQRAQDTPGAVLLTVKKNAARVKPFLEAWARVLGLRGTRGRSDVLQDRITAKIAGSDRLQLIDECHKLPSDSLTVIREVWDEARVPCVLSGTLSLYTRLTTKRLDDTSTELLAQRFSRIGIFRDLDEVAESGTGDDDRLHTREDIRKVFARGHVRLVKDGVDFLFSLANTPGVGGLRICGDLVQLCVDLYPGEPVTAERLRAAMVSKLGPREAGYKMNLAGPTDERSVKVAAG